jgi:hypothetical protein
VASFTDYLEWDPDHVAHRYAEIAGALARLHREIAFLKICELRDRATDRTERIDREGERDALIEEKFLLRLLVDARP